MLVLETNHRAPVNAASALSYLLSFLSSPQEGFLILKYNLSSPNIYLVFQAKLETERCVLRKRQTEYQIDISIFFFSFTKSSLCNKRYLDNMGTPTTKPSVETPMQKEEPQESQSQTKNHKQLITSQSES